MRAVARTARRLTAPRRLGLAQRGERRPVLIVSGPGGGARRYRGDNRREQLEAAGLATDVCYRSDIVLERLAGRYRCIVLYRVPWDREVQRLIERSVRHGTTVVADFDDLVFDPDRADLLRALDMLDDAEREAYVRGIAAQRRTLEESAGATLSTDPLAREAAAVIPQVEVVYNAVGTETVRDGRAARASARPRSGRTVRVGYLSGTPTHQRDFDEVGDALLWALDRYAELELVVAGFLELDPRFKAYGDRVVREPYRPAAALPALIATLDVNLAPLEGGNAFAEAKSCVKYLEAAVVSVPTLASPRPDFARVIEDGVNGLLCDSEDAWRDALAHVIEEGPLRTLLGERALADVLERHTTHATSAAAAAALERLVPGLGPTGEDD